MNDIYLVLYIILHKHFPHKEIITLFNKTILHIKIVEKIFLLSKYNYKILDKIFS